MFLFILAATVLTAFASLLLLYISLATGLGPWIAPMMVVGLRFFMTERAGVALITIAASFGGAIATGIGFSITTLYFVDRPLWEWLIAHPWWLCGGLGLLVLVGGAAGLLLARRCSSALINDSTMPFPVATAILNALDAKQQQSERWALGAGVGAASLIGLVRQLVVVSWSGFILPVGWAVGYFAGSGLAAPLLLGFCAHAVLVPYLVEWLALSSMEVTFALCAGLLLSGVAQLGSAIRQLAIAVVPSLSLIELGVAGAVLMILFGAGVPLIGLLIIAGLLVPLLYHLVYCASRSGLATYGRYMTLLMLPLLCVPGITAAHIVLMCTVVGIMGATVVDSVCAYKIAQQSQLSDRAVVWAQVGGVVVTALTVGLVLWWLCTHFTIGVAPLIAHRGLSRALLMQTFQFNGWLVLAGVGVGLVLSRFKINSAMVFGGMIMPSGLVLSLVGGSLLARFFGNNPTGSLFWTGVLAGDMLFLLLLVAATAIFW